MANYDDEFTPVDDAREYMNAPAMIMSGNDTSNGISDPSSASSASPGRMPLILQAALDYSAHFEILSADELQQYYSEQSSLQRRLTEVINRLDVELKMREAANSISRLHSGEIPAETKATHRASFSSNRSSIISSFNTTSPKSSPKTSNRLSRLLGQESQQQKSDKRLSKQAADEVAVSTEKIMGLDKLRAEIERRKYTVDCTICQHHCAVMARALTSKPLPNYHQRSRSGASILSSHSQGSQRQSWIIAPKHQRQWSSNSNGDAASLATVTEHQQMPNSRGSATPGAPSNSSINEEELNTLVNRIAEAVPQTSPQPQGKLTFIANAFDRLFRDLSETKNVLEASRVQITNSDQRIQYLTQQQQQLQQQLQQQQQQHGANGAVAGSRSVSNSGADEVMLTQLKYELAEERATSVQWRERAEQQRQQLENTVRSLEDVTRVTVKLEGERTEFEHLLAHLESKVSTLEADKLHLLQQKLGSTTNTSLLCREFQEIVSDLISRHERELRELYPMFLRSRASHNQGATTQQQPSSYLQGQQSAAGQFQSHQQSHSQTQHEFQSHQPQPQDHLQSQHLDQLQSEKSEPQSQVPEDFYPPRHPQHQRHSSQQSHLSRSSHHSLRQGTPLSPSQQPQQPQYGGSSRHSSATPSEKANSPRYTATPSPFSGGPSASVSEAPGSVAAALPSAVPPPALQPGPEPGSNANRLSLSSDALAATRRRPPSSTPSSYVGGEEEHGGGGGGLMLPQSHADSSYDDSIQHTNESVMLRPALERQNTEMSEFSKSSSYYPEAPSASQSQASIADPSGRSQTYLPQEHTKTFESYEPKVYVPKPYEPEPYESKYVQRKAYGSAEDELL